MCILDFNIKTKGKFHLITFDDMCIFHTSITMDFLEVVFSNFLKKNLLANIL
jgi:hypothetical protein